MITTALPRIWPFRELSREGVVFTNPATVGGSLPCGWHRRLQKLPWWRWEGWGGRVQPRWGCAHRGRGECRLSLHQACARLHSSKSASRWNHCRQGGWQGGCGYPLHSNGAWVDRCWGWSLASVVVGEGCFQGVVLCCFVFCGAAAGAQPVLGKPRATELPRVLGCKFLSFHVVSNNSACRLCKFWLMWWEQNSIILCQWHFPGCKWHVCFEALCTSSLMRHL